MPGDGYRYRTNNLRLGSVDAIDAVRLIFVNCCPLVTRGIATRTAIPTPRCSDVNARRFGLRNLSIDQHQSRSCERLPTFLTNDCVLVDNRPHHRDYNFETARKTPGRDANDIDYAATISLDELRRYHTHRFLTCRDARPDAHPPQRSSTKQRQHFR